MAVTRTWDVGVRTFASSQNKTCFSLVDRFCPFSWTRRESQTRCTKTDHHCVVPTKSFSKWGNSQPRPTVPRNVCLQTARHTLVCSIVCKTTRTTSCQLQNKSPFRATPRLRYRTFPFLFYDAICAMEKFTAYKRHGVSINNWHDEPVAKKLSCKENVF